MSARMVQRALRNHEAGSSGKIVPSDPGHGESDEDHAEESVVTNRFDLLGLQEDGVDDDEEDEQAERQSDQQSASGSASTSAPAPVKSKKKKNKGKKKGKQQQQPAPEAKSQGADNESVDQVLDRLAARNGEASSSTLSSGTAARSSVDAYDKHLGVDTKHLRAEDELRRIFGSKVINSVESGASGFQRRRQAASRRTGRGMSLRKSLLVVPMEHWARWDGGISMECTEVKDGHQYFRYKYSSSYTEVQKKFEICVRSHNPNTIIALLRSHPYHVDSLLALAEVYKHMGEYQQAADLLEQCLYALECAWHPCFNPSLGTCRLDYKIDANKALFLALFRHMQHLGKRGCHRTALEICKLLLSLDPKDPCGAVFCIDYFALRAEQYDWLRDFVEYNPDKSTALLPNFSYSLAMAWFHLEEKLSESRDRISGNVRGEVSAKLLQQALAIHPTVLKKIVDKAPIKGDAGWTEILNHPHFLNATGGGPTLEHLISIYVERSYLLWRAPELQGWLKGAAASVAELANLSSPEMAKWESKREEVSQSNDNQYQHLQVSEFSDSTSTLPPEEIPPLGFPPGFGPEGGFQDEDFLDIEGPDEFRLPQALQDVASQGRNALLVFLQSLVPWMERGVGGIEEGAPVLLDDSSDNNDSTAGEFGDESPM